MKQFLILSAALGLALTASAAKKDKLVNGERDFTGIYASYDGFSLPPEAVLPAKEIHPALWFSSPAEIAALREKRTADDYSRRLWQQLTNDPVLREPLPKLPKPGSKNFQDYYGGLSRAAKLNALMSLLADEGQREFYRARAVAALKRAFDGPVYEHTADKKNKEGIEDIHRATIAQNYAEAYDWVQSSLSKEDDALIRARLIREAKTIYDNVYLWVDRPHNHLSKPAWALGTLALTLSSEPQAKAWLARALKAVNQNTKYFFSADGIYREGAHYLMFSAVNFIPFLYHYRNAAGVDGFPAYQPAFEAVVATRNGKGWLPNLYDSYIRPFPTHMVAAAYRSRPTWLNPGAPFANVLQWNFRNTDFGAFNAAEKKWGFNYTGASLTFTLAADEFLTYDPTIPSAAPSVSPVVFLKGGQTTFRNNWDYNNPASRYLLFQGVAEADNHFHYDHLSFIIQAENQMMASDAGYTRGDYNDTNRKSWYMMPAAHNVVTADGKAPVDTADNVTPISRDRLDTSFFAFEEKEAPYPNGAVQKRAVAFPAKDYFVVIDQLSSAKPADYTLYLHGGRGEMKGDGNFRLWTYTNDLYGPAAQFAAWILSPGAKLEDAKGELTYIKGDWAEFGYVAARQLSAKTSFIQILVPLAAKASPPTVTDLSDSSRLAAVIEKGDATDCFIAQSGNATVTAKQISTDARFAWVRHASDEMIWALQQGTSLSDTSNLLVKASMPVTIAGRTTKGEIEAEIAAGTAECELSFPAKNDAVATFASFNGQSIVGEKSGGRLLFKLGGSGKLTVKFSSKN